MDCNNDVWKEERVMTTSSRGRHQHLETILTNLTEVETSLHRVLKYHQKGDYGFVTREWGFTAPGGLGGKLGGKFIPWETKLEHCRRYFWPIEVYESMEIGPDYGKPDPDIVTRLQLHPEREQLHGNTQLHQYLKEPPIESVQLESADFESYRDAARIFLLLGTLIHLYGNSAVNRTDVELPPWLEESFILVARRLRVEPTLSGHFLVQENWIWKNSMEAMERNNNMNTTTEVAETETESNASKRIVLSHTQRLLETDNAEQGTQKQQLQLQLQHMAKETRAGLVDDQQIVTILLKECICDDRRYRIKIYPNCFVGSQFVDVLIDHGYASTRADAVRIGRKLNIVYKLFTHVTNDHLLMDKHLFCTYR
jgi:hypothetical protein